MPYEIFMPINNYQGHDYTGKYELSNLGNVRNMKTKKVLKPIKVTTTTGYTQYCVTLYDTDNKQHTEIIARLVLTIFKANPDNKPQVNHRDENPSNNALNNLEWSTAAENSNYGSRNKRIADANKANGHYAKLAATIAATKKANGTYDKISDKLSIPVYCITNNTVYKSAIEASRQLNLDNSSITKCLKGKRKSTKGYQFKYYEGDVQ